jgi:hypothetical protein
MKEKSVLLGDSFGDKIIDKKTLQIVRKKGFLRSDCDKIGL